MNLRYFGALPFCIRGGEHQMRPSDRGSHRCRRCDLELVPITYVINAPEAPIPEDHLLKIRKKGAWLNN